MAVGTSSGWHLYPFLHLSRCCLLRELFLGADLGTAALWPVFVQETWPSVRTELSEPFGRK